MVLALLALFLGSCGMRAPHDDSASQGPYYYHVGVDQVSWELKILAPNGGATIATYDNGSPGGIVDGFTWSVKGNGAGVQMRFSAIPKHTPGLEARNIVQLIVDGKAVFWGPLLSTWPADDSQMREYRAAGGDELLAYRYALSPDYDDQPVSEIVSDLLDTYNHPALGVGEIADVGQSASVSSPGPVDLATIIGDLAKQAAVLWGVDATGNVVFGPSSGEVTADYHIHGLNWLPVEGDEIVTRGIVYGGAKTAGGQVSVWVGADWGAFPPWLIPMGNFDLGANTKSLLAFYTAPEHGQYGLEKAAVAPVLEIADRERNMLKPLGGGDQTLAGSLICSVIGGPEQTVDELPDGSPDYSTSRRIKIGKPESYSELEAQFNLGLPSYAAWGSLGYGTSLKLRINSNLYIGDDLIMVVDVWRDYRGVATFTLADKVQTKEFDLTIENLPADSIIVIHFRPGDNYDPPPCSSSNDYVEIKAVQGWGTIIPDAINTAKRLIKLPFQTPHEIHWTGEIVAPAGSVRVVTAGGDVIGPVDVWEYELTTRRRVSRARIGSPGTGEDTAAIKLYVDRIGQQAALAGRG